LKEKDAEVKKKSGKKIVFKIIV